MADPAYYCHQCQRQVRSQGSDLKCADCGGEFIEELTNNPYFQVVRHAAPHGHAHAHAHLPHAHAHAHGHSHMIFPGPPQAATGTSFTTPARRVCFTGIYVPCSTTSGPCRQCSSTAPPDATAPPQPGPAAPAQENSLMGLIGQVMNQITSHVTGRAANPPQQPPAPRQPAQPQPQQQQQANIPQAHRPPNQHTYQIPGNRRVIFAGGQPPENMLANILGGLGGAENVTLHLNIQAQPGAGGSGMFAGNMDLAQGIDLDHIVTTLLNGFDGPPPAEGLTAAEIERIPRATVTQAQVDNETQCTTCMDTFRLDEPVLQLNCNHIFHRDCLVPWFERHRTCPICRQEVDSTTWRPPPPPAAMDDYMDLD
ncbi:unnamed protein product, partial [Mesorhabditis spiculigera]